MPLMVEPCRTHEPERSELALALTEETESGLEELPPPVGGVLVGGVVVAPRASELIFPISLAVDAGMTVDQIAHAFTVYPSMTGSVAEAARLLHLPPD